METGLDGVLGLSSPGLVGGGILTLNSEDLIKLIHVVVGRNHQLNHRKRLVASLRASPQLTLQLIARVDLATCCRSLHPCKADSCEGTAVKNAYRCGGSIVCVSSSVIGACVQRMNE
ncbi:hypothetical protein [Oryza sativa Japonica Group]|uniref:Uncharacterized protein n=1 Tax=Oryza sativa subsp. japonica TaxID=39947 RepID=Q5ZD10_ORYSJ|nr:hypothetical protein [Oryza sativa Japonica Group]